MFRLGGHWYGCLFPKDPDHKLEEQQAGLLFEKRSALLQFFLNLREHVQNIIDQWIILHNRAGSSWSDLQ